MNSPSYQYKKHIIIFCMALVCFLQIVMPFYQAQAQILTIRTFQQPTDPDWIASWILKPLLRLLIAWTIQAFVEATVSWIKGDEGRNVGFVKNLEQEMINQADFRAGEVLNRIAGINLCSVNLRNFVTLQLKFPGANYNNIGAQLTCSLTGIVDNVDDFYRDFDNGGWSAFIGVTADPRNNAVGASLIALQNVSAAKGTVEDVLKQKTNASGGFQGVQIKKQSKKCEWVGGDPEGEIEPVLKCYTVDEVTTPGKLISETLNKSLNDAGLNFLTAESTNIMEQVANEIMGALMYRLMEEAKKNLF